MYLLLLVMLCLSCASFGRSEIPGRARTFARELTEEQDVMERLFNWMDGMIEKDNRITFPEYKKAIKQFDDNEDNILSPDELNNALELLNVNLNSDDELYFADFDLNDDTGLESWFGEFDQDYDGELLLSEFVIGFAVWLEHHQQVDLESK